MLVVQGGSVAVARGWRKKEVIMVMMMMFMKNIMFTMKLRSIDCLLSIGMVISSTALRCC